ncbi:MAG: response regulator transcription factor [Thermomicrobiales bacterium]
MAEPRTRDERILLVEDEEPIRELLTTALRFIGYTVETATTGVEGLALSRNDAWDLLVLDVNLPELDGFTLCRKVREAGNDVPVIFLTARDDPADLRAGFTGGGDDYLTKPFSLEELTLRVEAILRRGKSRAPERNRLTAGDLVLDDDAHRVWQGETELELTPTEYRLLRYLLQNAGRVVSRAQIIDHVWDYGYAIEPSGVETYISYLRRKLDDRDGKVIRTVRGVGYSLRQPEPAGEPG